jgi:hypothetical protein
MRQLVCACLLLLLIGLSNGTSVDIGILQKVARAFALKSLEDGPELLELTADQKADLKALTKEARQHKKPVYTEPQYKDELHASVQNSDTKFSWDFDEGETEIERRAEVIAGLRPKNEGLVMTLRSKDSEAFDRRRSSPTRRSRAARTSSLEPEMLEMRSLNKLDAKAQSKAETKSQTKTSFPSPEQINKREYLYRQGQLLARKLHGRMPKTEAQWYEDCFACRLVWRQVEMDVANARFVEDVEASFERNCMDLQKSQIFYKACEDMYDDLWAMTDDYMSSEYTVDKMCVRAKICRPIPFKVLLVHKKGKEQAEKK